ncbi:MAG: tetratricopeptide repeat protein [Prevotellaceae bacterium]|nr:tetratricopeptide repeat protein [Prevotella sp.]MDD7257440.1 tetratricopeptide repeat protein [Prevotellaceae bacterium]MDY6129995.1 tetratricopeptide repeat protein [Prevotella sp.]
MAKVKEQQVESFNGKEAFFLKYKKAIIYAVIAVIVVIAGVILYKNYVKGPREAEASTALAKGQELFASQMFDKALNGDGAGYAGFAKIASDYSSTNAGNLANLYAGLCYANMDKWQDAVKFLDKYSPSDDAMVSPAAMAALGNAYAHVNQIDKAIDNLKKAASMADGEAEDNTNNSLSPSFLIQAGELLESQGKKDEALKIYQDIKKKYVNSPVSQEIDKYIERASVK